MMRVDRSGYRIPKARKRKDERGVASGKLVLRDEDSRDDRELSSDSVPAGYGHHGDDVAVARKNQMTAMSQTSGPGTSKLCVRLMKPVLEVAHCRRRNTAANEVGRTWHLSEQSD
jgi:hypothetical protein